MARTYYKRKNRYEEYGEEPPYKVKAAAKAEGREGVNREQKPERMEEIPKPIWGRTDVMGGKARDGAAYETEAGETPYGTPHRGAPDGDQNEESQDGGDDEANNGAEQDDGDHEANDGAEQDDDIDSRLEEFYNRLYASLSAYGVTGIPSLDELYEMLEAFLRPSIEAAIERRRRYGETNMAELDADAYARGMGGSSFLSSMKAREYDDIEDDITTLEGKYTAELADYLYNAVNQMRELEQQLAASRSYGSGGGASGAAQQEQIPYGHNAQGAYFDGQWHEGDFSYLESDITYLGYCDYVESFTAYERYLLFTSNRREWRLLRWQLQYNLTWYDYNELYETYFAELSGDGGSGGGARWLEMLY